MTYPSVQLSGLKEFITSSAGALLAEPLTSALPPIAVSPLPLLYMQSVKEVQSPSIPQTLPSEPLPLTFPVFAQPLTLETLYSSPLTEPQIPPIFPVPVTSPELKQPLIFDP